MLISVLKSKIHRARITETELNYVGSITIDEDMMDGADLIEGEKVTICNVDNGDRSETYVIKGERGSGIICLNGPLARRAQVGDIVIVLSYGLVDKNEAKNIQPKIVFPDENNRVSQ